MAKAIDRAAFAADVREGMSTNALASKYNTYYAKAAALRKEIEAEAAGDSGGGESEDAAPAAEAAAEGSCSVTVDLTQAQVKSVIDRAEDLQLAQLIRDDASVHPWAAELLVKQKLKDLTAA